MSGWHTDVPGDDNLYQTAYDAMNTIDEQLGGTGKLGYAKTKRTGNTYSWKEKEK